MKSKEIAKALRLIAEGFTTLANAYEVEEPVVTGVDIAKQEDTTVKPETKEETKQEIVEPEVPKVEEPKEVVTEVEDFTEESLNAMSYNDLKALAKKIGVKGVGSKASIVSNILATIEPQPTVEEKPEPEVEEIKETAPVVEPEVIEEVPNEPVEEISEEEGIPVEQLIEEEKTFYDQVVADLEGYSDEELADVLADIGISPKGKRQALLAKIVQAIEDGLLEWDEEESKEATEPVKEEVETPTIIDESEEDAPQYSKAKEYAMTKEADRIYDEIKNGDLSTKEIIKYLKDFYNGQYEPTNTTQDVEEYIAIQCDLIDDEGIKHDLADPYYVGDDVYCCGQNLKEINDDYYCEICGTTYQK